MPRLSAAGASATKFAGGVIVISHDRWFLDRIATHILAYEGESKVTFFDGDARVGGRRARRGLPCLAHRQRGHGWGLTIAPAIQGKCSRHFTEYEDWRKQQLGDVATRPHRITYRRPTR